MEIKQNETHITMEVTKDDKVFSFILPVNSPFNDVFGVLFEYVNKVNELVIGIKVDEAIKKASDTAVEKTQTEVTAEEVEAELSESNR